MLMEWASGMEWDVCPEELPLGAWSHAGSSSQASCLSFPLARGHLEADCSCWEREASVLAEKHHGQHPAGLPSCCPLTACGKDPQPPSTTFLDTGPLEHAPQKTCVFCVPSAKVVPRLVSFPGPTLDHPVLLCELEMYTFSSSWRETDWTEICYTIYDEMGGNFQYCAVHNLLDCMQQPWLKLQRLC